jgi:hypothetical protein
VIEPSPPRSPRMEGEASAEMAALTSADLADARRNLAAAEGRAQRHLVWLILGLSPAALIPFVGLLIEGSPELLFVLVWLVLIVEGWRYLRASREVRRLRAVVARIEEGHREPL